MNTMLRTLRAPIMIEAANVLLHRIAHWTGLGGAYVDTASTLVSAAIVFYAGWVVSQQTRRYLPAIVAGLIVWAFSVALAAILMIADMSFFQSSLATDDKGAASAGALISSMLVLPAVIAISALAAFVARRNSP